MPANHTHYILVLEFELGNSLYCEYKSNDKSRGTIQKADTSINEQKFVS